MILPHDDAIEAALIGSCFLDPSVIDEVEPLVRPEDCYSGRHQALLEVLYLLRRIGRPIDALTAYDELKTRRQLERAGGPEYIARCLDSVPSASHAVDYAKRVAQYSQLRAVAVQARATLERIESARPEQASEVLAEAEGKLHGLKVQGDADDFQPMRVVVQEAMRATEAAWEARRARDRGESPVDVPSLEWGIADLDKVCSIPVADLTVIAAASNIGKSALAKGVVLHNARQGVPCAVAGMDDPRSQFGQRVIAQLAQELALDRTIVSNWHLTNGSALDRYGQLVTDGANKGCRLPIWVTNGRRLHIDELWSKARRLVSRYGLKMLVVDYLQQLKVSGSSDTERMSAVAFGLKDLSRDLGLSVVAVSQLVKAVESRTESRPPCWPNDSDIKGSGDIKNAAAVVAMPYRQGQYDQNYDQSKGIIRITKNKRGIRRDIPVCWHGPTCTWSAAQAAIGGLR